MLDSAAGYMKTKTIASAVRQGVFFFAAFVVVVVCIRPVAATEQALTPDQEKIVRSAEGKLIAPCCFRGTLAEHESEIATKLRKEVRDLATAGASEQQILDHFLEKYGERILAAPRAKGFTLLAYVIPVVGLAVGGMLILLFLRGAKGTGSAAQRTTVDASTPASDFDESVQARFKNELEHFER
jgi:cytochrome c-type biogenesis protein CcmH